MPERRQAPGTPLMRGAGRYLVYAVRARGARLPATARPSPGIAGGLQPLGRGRPGPAQAAGGRPRQDGARAAARAGPRPAARRGGAARHVAAVVLRARLRLGVLAASARRAAAVGGRAGPVPVPAAQAAVARGDAAALRAVLETVAGALERMHHTLRRMPDNCDPYIYYNRVRPFIHGWQQAPVLYEGVSEHQGAPQGYYGETGAQSTIVPCLDAVLGVAHRSDELRVYLAGMRTYMPPAHVAFLEQLEAGPSVSDFVLASGDGRLRAVYDTCVAELAAFRSTHLEYAARYIQNQTQVGANSNVYGTGGTPFMRYLRKHRDETTRHRVPVS